MKYKAVFKVTSVLEVAKEEEISAAVDKEQSWLEWMLIGDDGEQVSFVHNDSHIIEESNDEGLKA